MPSIKPESLTQSSNSSSQTALKHSLRTQWLILALALFVIACVIVYQGYTAHRNLTRQEHQRLQTQVRVIALNIESGLEATNLALVSIINDMRYLREHENLKLANRRLQALTDAMPGIRTMLIIDADGTVAASNRNELIGKNFRSRNYFATPAKDNDPSRLYLSPPFKTVLGSFVINVSRIIPVSNGSFGGIVTAALDPEYFNILLSSVLYAPDMQSTIVHGDGIRFMMLPDQAGQAGIDLTLPGTFFTRHLQTGKPESVMTGKAPNYNTEQVIAMRTVKPQKLSLDKPLYVACSRNLSAVYEHWLSSNLKQALVFVLISLCAGLALALLQQRQKGLSLQAARAQELIALRMSLMDYAATNNLQDLLRMTLDEVCRVSDSSIGFYHFVEPDQQTISLQTWSTRTLQEFCTAKGHGLHYQIEEAGVWADCIRQRQTVIHNDYASLQHRKGLPDGHAPVVRELVVPVFREEKVVAILGIGNKAVEYTEQDVDLVTYLANVAWEIIERKRVEEDLNNSEERFRTVADYTYDWEYWASPEGKLLYMTPSCERVTGYTAEEFMNDPALMLACVHPDDNEKLTNHLEYMGVESAPHHCDFRIITKNGETRWISHSCQAAYDSKGNYCGRRASNHDISGRKELSIALQDSRQRLADIFDFLPDATFVLDQDHKVIAWNKAIEELSGVFSKNMLGQGEQAYSIPFYGERRNLLIDLLDRKDDELTSQYQGVVRKGERLFAEAFCPALHNGKGAHVWAVVSPLYDSNGMRTGAIESIRDITVIKEAEANLARSNSELEQFAYVASHDLQEPLRKIAGFTELLASRYKGNLDEKAESYMAYIVDGATRMRSLINDLLKYSRVTRSSKEFANIDSSAVASRVLRDMELAVKESKAKVVCGTLPVIQADQGQIGQLFQNLISNAIKYRGVAAPEIFINAIQQGDQWLFSVADNGIGIAPEFYERIFAIFQRLHTRSEYSGNGIGLSVCQKIVERHGGKIWVESRPGAGSTFYFTVPFKQNHQEMHT